MPNREQTGSRIAGINFLSDVPNNETPLLDQSPPLKSPMRVEVCFLKMVATSASEADLGEAYVNTKIG